MCEKFKSKNITPIYQTYGDNWTTQQGLFDYTAGGMIDVAAFYQGLVREGTNLGPDSPVSFEKDFTAPCKQMLTLAPYFNENPIAKHYADGNLAFANGQAGMYMQGPWAVGQVLAIKPEAQDGHLRPARHRRRVPDQERICLGVKRSTTIWTWPSADRGPASSRDPRARCATPANLPPPRRFRPSYGDAWNSGMGSPGRASRFLRSTSAADLIASATSEEQRPRGTAPTRRSRPRRAL